jgi:hypothetical protein
MTHARGRWNASETSTNRSGASGNSASPNAAFWIVEWASGSTIIACGGMPASAATAAIASAADRVSLPAPVKTTTGATPAACSAAQVSARPRETSSGRAEVSPAIPAPRQKIASAGAGETCGAGQRSCTVITAAKLAP